MELDTDVCMVSAVPSISVACGKLYEYLAGETALIVVATYAARSTLASRRRCLASVQAVVSELYS
eukprot:scaffold406244_cov22-Prasinocladus_malaysianus.AAC.1